MRKIGYAFLAALLLAGCSPSKAPEQKAQTPAPPAETSEPKIYVTNEVGGDLSIVDSGNYNLLATVKLGKRPRGIHPSPDHKFIYVALSGSPIAGPDVDESTLPPPDKSADGIGVFEVATNKVLKMLPAGSDPENFDVSPDGKEIYVSNEDEAAVSIIDIDAGKIVKTLKMGAQPEGVKVTPNGKLVWVTSEETGTISVLDPVAGHVPHDDQPAFDHRR